MKYLKLFEFFKQFEVSQNDIDYNYADEDNFQKKMREREIIKKYKPMGVVYGKDDKANLKGWSPIKYTDVPLDVYLKRKETGETEKPKIDDQKFRKQEREDNKKLKEQEKINRLEDIKLRLQKFGYKNYGVNRNYDINWVKTNFGKKVYDELFLKVRRQEISDNSEVNKIKIIQEHANKFKLFYNFIRYYPSDYEWIKKNRGYLYILDNLDKTKENLSSPEIITGNILDLVEDWGFVRCENDKLKVCNKIVWHRSSTYKINLNFVISKFKFNDNGIEYFELEVNGNKLNEFGYGVFKNITDLLTFFENYCKFKGIKI